MEIVSAPPSLGEQSPEDNSPSKSAIEAGIPAGNASRKPSDSAPEGQPHRRIQENRQQRPQHNQPSDRATRERSRHLSQLYSNARVQVERIRRDLESVLAELEKLSNLLSQAEHDQELTEQEIETLKDALHNLHRGQQITQRGGESPGRSEE